MCSQRGNGRALYDEHSGCDGLPFRPIDLYFNEIRLIPSYSCGPNDTREALQLIRDRVVTAEKFITHRLSILGTA